MSSDAPHRARELAESFGADPARYHRTRPSYPAALVQAIVDAAPGPDVLDVGCGTGLSALPLRAAGCRVTGVEVDARMADFARARGLDVEVGAFERWDPAGRAFDAVVSGQAWHWVDPVAGAARAAAALRPGGRLVAFWNVFDAAPEVARAFADAYRRALPGEPLYQRAIPGPDGYAPILDATAAGIRAAGAFAEPERWRFDWERAYTRDEWLEQVPTFGGHSRFPPDRLAALLDGLGAAIDALGGRFTMGYATVAVAAGLLPAARRA